MILFLLKIDEIINVGKKRTAGMGVINSWLLFLKRQRLLKSFLFKGIISL
jgi:hypothetical protein